MPVFLTFSTLLAFGLAGVLAGRAVVEDEVLKKQLLLRWMSWALIAPITMLAILSGPVVFAFLAAIVSLICVAEFCKITNLKQEVAIVISTAAVLLPLLTLVSVSLYVACFLIAAAIVLALWISGSIQLQQPKLALLALLYIPVLASHAVLFCKMQISGAAMLISVITASALANIAAFVFGKILGGPKLAPQISPNKTWSGVAGSIFGSYLGFLLLANVLGLHLSITESLVIPPVIAVAGVLGDLFESFIKRSFQVKDAGSWLPGFGGALDRVDGLLFVVPATYYFLSLAI